MGLWPWPVEAAYSRRTNHQFTLVVLIIMKLTYDDKVQIYELRKQGYSLEKLSNKFGINNSNIRYMIKLIDRYGIEFVKKGKNRYYSPDLKQEMIHKV
ncbi:transposase orfA, ISSmu1 [Streptococcus pneumoniae]|nr:transposase orfA, ISSmu1 [Streptococcus pneumoniae]VIU03804.1 transposase orfA, ISSmu1 [Streptococcus pneumoniae]